MRSLAQSIHFDPRKLFQPNGSLIPVHELDEDTAMALASFEVVEKAGGMAISCGGDATYVPGFTKKVKWVDKNVALDKAARILGLYKDKIEVGAADDFVTAMLNGRRRASIR